jgi:hypothetical protein
MRKNLKPIFLSVVVLGVIAIVNSTAAMAQVGNPGGRNHEEDWECFNGLDDDNDGDIDGFDSDCGGGGGGGEPPAVSQNNVQAGWRGDVTEVTIAAGGAIVYNEPLRNCTIGSVQQDGYYIAYECEDDTQPIPNGMAVEVDLTGWLPGVQTQKNGDDSICDAFINQNSPFLFRPLTEFDFRKEGTNVRVQNWAFESDAALNFDPPVGLIRLSGFGVVDAQAADGDGNPFSDDQLINISLIRMTYVAAGKNKNLAVCEYTSPAVNSVQFETDSPLDP